MKAKDAKRAAILAEAFNDMDFLASEIAVTEPKKGYDRRVLELQVSSVCGSGSECEGSVEIDLETAALLLPILRDLLRGEMEKIGVEP